MNKDYHYLLWKKRLSWFHFRTTKMFKAFVSFVFFATVQKCRSMKRVCLRILSLIIVNKLRFKNNHAQLFVYHYYYYFNVLLVKWLFVVCQYNRSIYRLATSQSKSKKTTITALKHWMKKCEKVPVYENVFDRKSYVWHVTAT